MVGRDSPGQRRHVRQRHLAGAGTDHESLGRVEDPIGQIPMSRTGSARSRDRHDGSPYSLPSSRSHEINNRSPSSKDMGAYPRR